MPAKTVKPPVRGRRTKVEVQQEFADIQEQAEAARESADAKAEEAVAVARRPEVRQAVDGVTVEGVVQRISGLGLEVSKALADVSGKLTREVQLLASVREAVALERTELERLHKIDVAATALDQMVQDYAREKQRLEAEIAAQRGGVGGRIGARRARAQRAGRESQESSASAKSRTTNTRRRWSARRRRTSTRKRCGWPRRRIRNGRRRSKRAGSSAKPRFKEAGAGIGAAAQGGRGVSGAPAEGGRRRRPSRRGARPKPKFEQQTLVLKKDAETEKRLAELQREDARGNRGAPGRRRSRRSKSNWPRPSSRCRTSR